MIDDIYTLYKRPDFIFLLNKNDTTMNIKDFGQGTLNSNKFKHKQKYKKKK